MSRVFVTTGTTPFPRLVQACDRPSSHEVVIQTADPGYEGSFAKVFAFSDEVDRYYRWADLIITHAGAGSVYSLLEQGKRIVAVPNLDRADKHQVELARFVADGGYGLAIFDIDSVSSLDALVARALAFEPRQYEKDRFFKAQEIVWMLTR